MYYGPDMKRDVVGPDLYIVNGGLHRGQEKWIVALEDGLKPTLVMEFMSDTTRKYDQAGKLELYRDKVGVLDYFLIDRGPIVRGFHLHGSEYVPVLPDASGLLPCSSLPLKVGVRDGWVRWFDLGGDLLPTRGEFGEQRAEAERRQAEAAIKQAAAERQRADALERQLRDLQARLERTDG